jgi:hypothetical protein
MQGLKVLDDEKKTLYRRMLQVDLQRIESMHSALLPNVNPRMRGIKWKFEKGQVKTNEYALCNIIDSA